MKKAVLLFAHKDAEQLNVFIEQLLQDACTDIFIHVDKKNDALRQDIQRSNHVFITNNNLPITWGDDSMVRALVVMLTEVLEAGLGHEYLVISTGQDLMVKPGLDAFLEQNKGKIYLEASLDEPRRRAYLLYRWPRMLCRHLGKRTNPLRMFRSLWFRLIHLGLIPKKPVSFDPSQIVFWKSFNWSAMPMAVVRSIVEFLDQNPGLVDLYLDSLLPEDGFLGTLIMNSAAQRDVVFLQGSTTSTRALTYHKGLEDGQHIRSLSTEDMEAIDASGCFFARKFDLAHDPAVVRHYQKLIVGKVDNLGDQA